MNACFFSLKVAEEITQVLNKLEDIFLQISWLISRTQIKKEVLSHFQKKLLNASAVNLRGEPYYDISKDPG